jgi:hypothetical protein
MTKAQDLKIIKKKDIKQNEYRLAEDIYCKLNQGGLFEIYQIMDSIKSAQVRDSIEQAFVEKYNFNFQKYI